MDNSKNISKNNDPWWQESLLIFVRYSAWIVGPVLAAIYLGSWLDNKLNSDPLCFLLSTSAAFIISMGALITNTVKEYKKIEKDNQNK